MNIYGYQGRSNLSGDRIRKARKRKRLSQSDLAAKMQLEGIAMAQDSISRAELGTRFIPDYELPLYAKILNVSVEWLLGMDE